MKRSMRLFHTAILISILKASNRVKYMKKHSLFGEIGEGVHIQSRILPLHSEAIHLHNNVKIASGVSFVTHDIIHKMLNQKFGGTEFLEQIDCIEVMDSVFIGANSIIMSGVKIGSNVIIGAGSIVTRDVPSNCVYAGVPARYITSFDEVVIKRKAYSDMRRSELEKETDGNDYAERLYANFTKRRAVTETNPYEALSADGEKE